MTMQVGPDPDAAGPFTALDARGRRFLAATQAEADAMRDEWLFNEGRQQAMAAMANEQQRQAEINAALSPPVWVRLWRWFIGGSQP